MTNLRDKDQTVLQQIHSGNNDTQQITEATTLSNREVNYCLTKLQDHDLIQVHKPEGMIERTINGQKRVFEHPKQAQLTDKGQEHLSENPPQNYEDLSHKELVQKVRTLEQEIEQLKKSLNTFREQVQKRL
jgi:DNA-binding transcriptional regulator GbsR (MarR family)